ncbi:alpha/beta fold hydrolase [Nonomuraea sp. NPDC050536]|uniref:alpha/beta fold hydrolase n=1 Tax=Nonomuraea sp. NPDC050536 TaxID=3364366 RepID=UPI0037C7B60F
MLKTTVALTLLLSPTPTAPSALDWAQCPGDKIGMECADLQVPLDWDKPDGRRITLKLGRLKATGTPEGSVLVAYGGPGGPGIAITQGIPDTWAGLRKRMNVVTWDTRGYGKQFQGLSTGLPCTWTRIPVPAFPRDDAEWGRLADTNRGYAEPCRQSDPDLFAHMSSADQARDMEAIRKALGEQKLNYYGASYAGFYGQDYARLFPGKVRTIALDGTWSHSAPDWNAELDELARAGQKAMDRFFASCGCRPQWRALIAKADRRPIRAKDIAYSGRDLQDLALGTARQGPAAWPGLAKAISAAARGDASGFVPERGLRYPDQSTGVTECVDWPRFTGRAELDAAVKRLRGIAPDTGTAGTIAEGTLGCVGWPVPVTNPPKPLPNGLPPLLGAGNWGESDAVERVLTQVPGSITVRHGGPGHTLYMSNACARAHIDRYLTEAVLPPRGTAC